MVFNLVMGVAGLVLAGHSLWKKMFLFAGLELIAGLYFVVAAIGASA